MGKFFEEKTEWVISGPFGVRRIWKDKEGKHYYLVNNIAIYNTPFDDSKIDVFKSESVRETKKRTMI